MIKWRQSIEFKRRKGKTRQRGIFSAFTDFFFFFLGGEGRGRRERSEGEPSRDNIPCTSLADEPTVRQITIERRKIGRRVG